MRYLDFFGHRLPGAVAHLHLHLHLVAVAVHVHRAAVDRDRGIALEVRILQAHDDGVHTVVLAVAFAMPALAAAHLAFATVHAAAAIAVHASTPATMFASHAHFGTVPTATAPATVVAAHAADREAECEREQAEEEDLGPVGVHGGWNVGAKVGASYRMDPE